MATTVEDIIKINKQRKKKLYETPDQITGKGMEGHTEVVRIPDYYLPEQYVYPEVAENNLFKNVVKAGSIENYLTQYNQTHEEQITRENVEDSLFIIRAQNDPAFVFAVCFVIIIKETGEKKPFILRYAQRLLLWELEKMRRAGVPIRLILLKARQWGGSTLVQLYMAWIQLFLKEGWNSVIVAQTDATAKRIKAMYSLVLDKFPAFIFDESKLQFSPKERSSSDYVIANSQRDVVRDNTVIVSSYEHIDSEAGANIALAHFSEVALWNETPSKTPESVLRVINGGMLEVPLTLQVLESTARGRAGYFYEEWQEAKAGRSSRVPLFIPFYYIEFDTLPFSSKKEEREFAKTLLENKDQLTTEDKTAEPGAYLYSLWLKGATLEHIHLYVEKRKQFHDHAHIASELPSDDVECFMYSGNLIFNADIIERQRKDYCKLPIWQGDISITEGKVRLHKNPLAELLIWKQPVTKLPTIDRYLVTVDVGGRGERADYSVITVFDRWATRIGGQLQVVARWRGHLRYDLMARKAVAIAEYYCHAMLVFESNTFDKKKAEAKDYVEQGDHIRGILATIEDEYDNLYMRPATDEEDIRNGILSKVGFNTNKKTKQDIVDAFLVAFEDDLFIDPDERFYTEAGIYEQRTDGSYGNIQGKDNHDDIVMTDMIGWYVHRRMEPPKSKPQIHTTSRIHRTSETINESSL